MVDPENAYTAEHGWLDAQGNPPGFVNTYFAALNGARLALDRLASHLKATGRRPSMVVELATRGRTA